MLVSPLFWAAGIIPGRGRDDMCLQDAHSCEGCRINATSLRRAQGPPCFFGRRFLGPNGAGDAFRGKISGPAFKAVTVAHSGNIRNWTTPPAKSEHVCCGVK